MKTMRSRTARGAWTLPAAAMLLLAGCASGEDTTRADPSPLALPHLELGTGGIEGRVFDDSLLPVAGATVWLAEDMQNKTDPDGGFVFVGLEPGDYDLHASKTGYDDAVRRVQVQADAYSTVVMELTARPDKLPYAETLSARGLVGCAVAFRTIGPPPLAQGTNSMCNAASRAVGPDLFPPELDKSYTTFVINLQNSSGFWGETEWKSTQALGGGMQVTWYYLMDPGRLDYGRFNRSEGPSPVQVRVSIEAILQQLGKEPSPLCGIEKCIIDPTHTAAAELDTVAGVGKVGVLFMQTYTDYITIFRNQPLPEAFSILPDS